MGSSGETIMSKFRHSAALFNFVPHIDFASEKRTCRGSNMSSLIHLSAVHFSIQLTCYSGVNVSLQSSYVETLIPNRRVSGDRACVTCVPTTSPACYNENHMVTYKCHEIKVICNLVSNQ